MGVTSVGNAIVGLMLIAVLVAAGMVAYQIILCRLKNGLWPWELPLQTHRQPVNRGELPKPANIGPAPQTNGALPYRAVDSVLSKGELAFFSVLFDVCADRFTVLAKVRLSDLVDVTDRSWKGRRWFNRIAQKHVDFVLCEPGTMRPVLIIELDDRSHMREDRAERDEFVDECLRCAGLRLLRIKAQAAYDVGRLRGQTQQSIV